MLQIVSVENCYLFFYDFDALLIVPSSHIKQSSGRKDYNMNNQFGSSANYGLQRQFQVFLEGLQGKRPHLPVDADALEQAANAVMTPEASGYLKGMTETMQGNRAAFQRWKIVPRMLRNVEQRDLSIQLFNKRYPVPLLLAPIGVQSIIHTDAEAGVARAAAALGIPLILSTVSTIPLEQVCQTMGDAPRWFQLYWSKDPDFNTSIIARAEQAGCEAIVVTLDTNLLAWRPYDIQNAYLPFLLGQGIGNYLSDPIFRKALTRPPEEDPQGAIQHFLQIFTNPSLTWQDLTFLREHTQLPILLKGILHPDDARQAIAAGMDGIIVSNHGGRQVAGAIASLDALPAIVEAVQGQIPILLDSGIRRASDVIKALALGAQAVLLGRPYIWGLALNGEQGVREVLTNFLADLDLTLALSGYSSFSELDPSALYDKLATFL
jgi:isopentenyl diphosphate isomerase/L-lactate dehydrogenase-like FMN-dependent dehydrogenase